ncbi:MAG TPA: hypothetical protein VI894_02390 [Candidatus Nanoarchaeia archaeon]|nr:hypothetical protein [Candidatus Nanoarchaeia archaeon]
MVKTIYHCPRCSKLMRIEGMSFCYYCGKFFDKEQYWLDDWTDRFWTNMEIMS